MYRFIDNKYYELTDPICMPKASGFLWNDKMVILATCRGYATAQFMQPEPAKYSHAPNMEGKNFITPELPYYADHAALAQLIVVHEALGYRDGEDVAGFAQARGVD